MNITTFKLLALFIPSLHIIYDKIPSLRIFFYFTNNLHLEENDHLTSFGLNPTFCIYFQCEKAG